MTGVVLFVGMATFTEEFGSFLEEIPLGFDVQLFPVFHINTGISSRYLSMVARISKQTTLS